MNPPRFCTRAFEFQAESSGDGRTLEGYAAVFDTPTRIDSWEGQFDEQLAPGSFKRTLAARTPVMQFDHGRDVRTGSVPIAAIEELREDGQGLYVRARMFDNPTVEPIRQAIEGGAIDGMSFKFSVPKNGDQWTKRAEDVDLRTIREVALYELGPVVFPAYEATTVGVRTMLAGLDPHDRDELVRALAAEMARYEIRITADDSNESDATPADPEPAERGTSEEPATEPAALGTSGLSAARRARILALPDLLEAKAS